MLVAPAVNVRIFAAMRQQSAKRTATVCERPACLQAAVTNSEVIACGASFEVIARGVRRQPASAWKSNCSAVLRALAVEPVIFQRHIGRAEQLS